MANKEHLDILKKGVPAWNKWRENNQKIQPDLSETNLSGADLGGTDLSGTNLNGANLSEAKLFGANLGVTDLSGANLNGANLILANLIKTFLNGADLTTALLGETIFSDVDLSETDGLDECQHLGPSTVDHRTLMKSGALPPKFLRGVGLPEDYIQLLPSFRNEPFQFYSCFISYSEKDRSFAESLYADLQAKGVRCWFAREDLKIGDKFRDRIDESIRIYDKLLLIFSKDSIASNWVESEVEAAFEKERKQPEDKKETVLFPIRLDGAVNDTDAGWAADIRRSRHIGDFTNWKDHDSYQKNFERLMRDLKSEGEENP
ncbi:MAG: toll/interleukin-1 receptor domain-containing protein [Nitrospinaceae bacterium]|jgi:hypothetical protein|nr:toll/interleukin-1 receptor domain-containing protein [Nitrospinaceae bacterium]MBT3434857.1 toll/interleukin-1 receptor domain-containing protein [Nitrospinaceae bacterium]MBT3822393.1 toll/interleukin-1 receptor domain-containing protein [Nitrospinaceae bacterium]MBT4094234.1 toll/interleukin-1 receptor domain-containing protein [Nitrospinaceae bacterium]MBT4430375.1 toll/interleukin-1 receptor domain-containing protein [Nitrospinaceae bacterium]